MREHPESSDGPLWANGDMIFRVAGGAEPDRLVKVRQPFALVGRAPTSDLLIDDRAAGARHAYLHLDRRGVYAVDLVTRTGTRVNGVEQGAVWIRPGDVLEIAGLTLELLRIRIDNAVLAPPRCDDDMLSDSRNPDLVGLTLEADSAGEPPWVLGSELVFLGWSASCGIQVKDPTVAKIHCALMRSPHGAFLIDVCSRQTWVEDRLVRGVAALHDGDLITLGSARFHARVTPPRRAREVVHLPEVIPRGEAAAVLARFQQPGSLANFPPALNTDVVPAEAQHALLGWLMGAIQAGQGEVLRRQGEYHLAMTQVLRQMQTDNATVLEAHLRRIENNDQEIIALRSELERRNNGPSFPPLPDVEPLKIQRPDADAADGKAPTTASTSWLLDRVNHLEEENRSAFKDLVGRIMQPRKAN